MKFKLTENINEEFGLKSTVDMLDEEILSEATYGLTDTRKLSKADLINKVASWKMIDLFKENDIDTLPPGFSITSNQGGYKNKNIFDQLSDSIAHHLERTHKSDNVIRISLKNHTKLHDIIRNILKEEIYGTNSDLGAEIDTIYKQYLKAYERPLKSYDDFGSRLEAYENALKNIWKVIGHLLSDDEYMNKIGEKALKILIPSTNNDEEN